MVGAGKARFHHPHIPDIDGELFRDALSTFLVQKVAGLFLDSRTQAPEIEEERLL